jgi:hypothetical protein
LGSISSTPTSQKVRNRSATMVGGAPIRRSNSPNRVAPRKAAPSSAIDPRLPIMIMVWATSSSGRVPECVRRRVAADGMLRFQPPLGPKRPEMSRASTCWSHASQSSTGVNVDPHLVCRISGSGTSGSSTQCCSQAHIVISTGHS